MSEVYLKIKDILSERDMTQKELADKSEVRESTISDIVRGSRTVINFKHLAAIADALEITDITELIELRPSNISKE